MAKPQRGLGKGLSALLGNETDVISTRTPVRYVNADVLESDLPGESVRELNIDRISPNPFQPRLNFDRQALEELAESIRTLGLIQPITVRKVDNFHYQIISGERRFRASQIAGLKSIPVYVRETDDMGMLELAIVENVQRENLDPIETAISYQRLLDECHLTQEKMAERIGKSRVSVTNSLRLLKLPARVQYDIKVGNISVGHAKVLLSVDDPQLQEKLCDSIIKEDLSVRSLETILKNEKAQSSFTQRSKSATNGQTLPQEVQDVVSILSKYFDNNVTAKCSSSEKGVISVRFSGENQISGFLAKLKKAKF